MKRRFLLFVVPFVVLLFIARASFASFWEKDAFVRPAMVAGQFYPADPGQLRAAVKQYLSFVPTKDTGGTPFALVVPHAGYEFSGQVAAHSFAQVNGRHYKRVVILAPSHLESFPFASIYGGDAYTTPLGKVPVDTEFAKKLAQSSSLLKISTAGHGVVQGRGEHAIEVELPFLQELMPQIKIVPIVMGGLDYDLERALGVALADTIMLEGTGREPDTLVIASSDLSHYHIYDKAVELDGFVLDAIQKGDFFSLSLNTAQRVWEACGGGPIVSAMMAADRLGARDNVILNYANSGDVTGDKSRVVGYGAAAFVRKASPSENSASVLSLSPEEKKQLLSIAKQSVETAVRKQQLSDLPDNLPQSLRSARGAFVTLKKNGQLRGCIGFITPSKPLAATVRDVAASAALRDTRFRPVGEDELNKLHYEISVLSPLRRVANAEDVRVGREGLIIRKGEAQGLLLPQVPTEQGWDRMTFIQQTAVKAGLPSDAWQSKDADLFSFTALVFGDK